MWRLGILLGACGGILGGCLAYSDAKATWDSHTAARKFESLMASPTMQKVAKAARDYQIDKWGGRRITTGQVAYDANNQIMEETKPQDTTHGPWEKYKLPPGAKLVSPPVPVKDPWEVAAKEYKAGKILVSVNLEGIKQVTVDEAGLVSSIELSTGESVQRLEPPTLKAYVVPLLYPILGFLFPWGGIRVLTWVGTGFFAAPR